MNDKSAKPAIEMVTLKQICAELKVEPRDVGGEPETVDAGIDGLSQQIAKKAT